jgi:radical SAM superfamily enzyme YgiQ (UPF0313 family)
MNKIAIYNLEPKYINIALEKIKMYYELKGDHVENYFALNHNNYDKIYCSSIFDFTDKKFVTPDMICGGTGFKDLINKKLPKYYEEMKPKLNAGFCSRGCIRNCKFCLVRQKEGCIKATGDIYDLWDGISKEIILHDNNLLALPDHFKLICSQIKKENLRVDFNQGLDIRLVTDEICEILKSIKTKKYRFAFDDDSLFPIIKKKIKLLKKYKITGVFYILVGFNSDFDNELKRINYLHLQGQRAYVMRHKNCDNDKRYIALYNWCNNPVGFRKMDFYKEFLESDFGKKAYTQYFKNI